MVINLTIAGTHFENKIVGKVFSDNFLLVWLNKKFRCESLRTLCIFVLWIFHYGAIVQLVQHVVSEIRCKIGLDIWDFLVLFLIWNYLLTFFETLAILFVGMLKIGFRVVRNIKAHTFIFPNLFLLQDGHLILRLLVHEIEGILDVE